jgi:hydroxymethylpyrimidine kinase/phosphomethylpyrimidine kinase
MSDNAKQTKSPVVLAIGGLDPSGGAGIIADVRAIAAHDCIPAAAVTSITFQNSKAVTGAEHMSADTVRRQMLAVLGEYDVAAVKTGMLATAETVKVVAEIVAEHHLRNLVIDPVIRSTSGFQLIDDAALDAMLCQLLPLATLITPNVPEIEHITGFGINEIEDITAAAASLHEKGARSTLIKGGHMPDSINTEAAGNRVSRDFLFHNGQMTVFENALVPNRSIRGSGCLLASSIAANLARGASSHESVSTAKTYVYNALMNS